MMKENSRKVLEFLKAHNDDNYTATEVASALGIDVRVVNGSFTQAICKKNLGYRQPAEIENEDGTHTQIKFLKLTPAGMSYNPDDESTEA